MSFLRHRRMLEHIRYLRKAGRTPASPATCRRKRTRLSLGRLVSTRADLRFTLVSEGIGFATEN